MVHEFKPSPKVWIGNLLIAAGLTVFIVAILLTGPPVFPRERTIWIAICLCLLCIPLRNLFYLYGSFLTLDDTHLYGSVGIQEFKFSWSDILTAEHFRGTTWSGLRLRTNRGNFDIPLGNFDHFTIWSLVQTHLPKPAATNNNAGSPANSALTEGVNKMVWDETLHLRITTPILARIYFIVNLLTVGFAICIPLASPINRGAATFMFAMCGSMTVIGLFTIGTIEMDIQEVRWISRLFCKRIRWEEVNTIDQWPSGGRSFVICSSNDTITLPGLNYWNPSSIKPALNLIFAEIDYRHIEYKSHLIGPR